MNPANIKRNISFKIIKHLQTEEPIFNPALFCW